MSTIYFGGQVERFEVGVGEAPLDLDTLSSESFRMLFSEWITQCWMQNTGVPNDERELANFDLDALVPLFRKRYTAGDWKHIVQGLGVTLEQFVMWLQLSSRVPVAIVLNTDKPKQPLGRIRQKLLLPTFEIGACVTSHLYFFGHEKSGRNN